MTNVVEVYNRLIYLAFTGHFYRHGCGNHIEIVNKDVFGVSLSLNKNHCNAKSGCPNYLFILSWFWGFRDGQRFKGRIKVIYSLGH